MGCKQTKRIEATLEASTVRWGKQGCISVALSETSENDFFEFQGYDPQGEIQRFYVWIDEGTGVDPEETGTAVPVAVLAGDSEAQRAEKIATAINGLTGDFFKAEAEGDSVHIENRFIGKVEEADSSASFTVTIEVEGTLVDLGATSDSIDVSLDVEVFDIQSNQTGGLVLDQIFQGSSASLSASFIEISKEKFDELVGQVTGNTVTPASGTAVTGFGEGRLFQSLLELGGQLILHPIRLPATDYSADTTFWKCAPIVNSENFSGTDARALEIEFNAYLDNSKDKGINLYAKGDWTQVGLDA